LKERKKEIVPKKNHCPEGASKSTKKKKKIIAPERNLWY
jgi:hypothetical protein